MNQPEIINQDSPEYDAARRVWNGMIDRKPRSIVRCRTTDDVAAAIAMARSESLPLAVRSGGHNVAGFATCDDGVVIDLSPMNQVEVDAAAREATVGGGALWGHIDHETQKHGMIVPGGLVSTTGVGGFTLGGGLSWTRNLYTVRRATVSSVRRLSWRTGRSSRRLKRRMPTCSGPSVEPGAISAS